MAEVSPDATILIAISWQALNRAIQGKEDTRICDCIVIILFASFYIEANLNYIIEYMNMTQQMRQSQKVKYPGLHRKLDWFYNQYGAGDMALSSGDKSNKKEIWRKLEREFPGFRTILDFRNDISHGVINLSVANITTAKELRQQAKDIVDKLFKIAKKNGHDIPRITNYQDVITQQNIETEIALNPPNEFIIPMTSSS